MITAYHRPHSIDEALQLLRRPAPVTVPLGGGTLLSHYRGVSIEVVDLQALGLNRLTAQGNEIEAGATVTLQQVLEMPACPVALALALRLEAPINLRNAATIAGTLASCDGRSSLVTMLLALDATLNIAYSDGDTMPLGEYLARRSGLRPGYLIKAVKWSAAPLAAYEYVARTPADRPIVAVAVAGWPSGRTRAAVGGYGMAPVLAMDGPLSDGIEAAVESAMQGAEDGWGSAAYRAHVAPILARRCLERLT